ncbi:TolC family protein [Hymenobacter psychrophilus]|uniref:Outer membrane protein TolC n=1 Tax=Hymenobacter psychrophilus TaxID=651662 RepID=A0A1H3LKS1_9BACT|nr:TolC family protein [Hymenobacter psychrophilus]SDY65042.1 Outer membrane protein TolC [Hymenobacter psychrophilus]
MKFYFILLLLLLLVPRPGAAQQGLRLPLDSVLRRVDRDNPGLRRYEARIGAAEAYAKGARTWAPPTVGAGPFMMPYTPRQTNDNGPAMRQGSIMLSVDQNIPNGARQRANERYLQSRTGLEQESRAYERNQLLSEARQHYYSWALLLKKQRILDGSEELLRFIIRSIELRYKYGGEKLSDAFRAKAELQRQQAEELEVQGRIDERRIALNTLMNRPPNEPFEIDSAYARPDYRAAPDTATLARSRSDVRRLDQTLVRTRLQQELELTSRKPEFGVRYQHMNALGGNNPNLYTLQGMVSIPIAPWAARGYKANVAALGLEAEALREERAALVVQATGRASGLLARLQAKAGQIALYEQRIVPAVLKSYRATLLAYEQNTEQLTAVLQAWEALRATRLEAVNQELEYVQLQTDYEREIEQ